MKRNILLGLSFVLIGGSAFGMEAAKPTITVSLGHWKNDTDKNLLINQEIIKAFGPSSDQNIAKLPAKADVNLKKEIQLAKSIAAGSRVSGFYDASVIIKDPQNPNAHLRLQVNYEEGSNRIEVGLSNSVKTGKMITVAGFSFPETNTAELDDHMYDRLSKTAHIIIQGTIRGDNFGESKIELLSVER